MDLYFSPLACSMATRIALYEAGLDCNYVRVDTKTKRVADGSDFLAVNPMGQVPVVRTDDGERLTENTAILQYVAGLKPEAGLAPQEGFQRHRLQQWLAFITSELHKAVFSPLFSPNSPEGAKAFARQCAEQRFAYLNDALDGREFLLDRFTVADAYLTTVLNWANSTGIDLGKWPAVQAYFDRLRKWPSVARAMAEEFALYRNGKAPQTAA
ncbi:glutathione S-transferase N-terminal domain-containing protein [Shumkonia mesophila]|uniref:glutathione S-transferase N-terminal domain-containing protein n=1 Tax=Shumkonia mesophila TaxID=2838854 RepID=UPI002935223A|nr:glutathione S-transferase N-terminal domain-containing protein [Shumkonia mesophila]